MKVAILSDVHSNIYALEEVIKDIKNRKCDFILCLGDYIGYYYWPNEVIDLLRSMKHTFFIRGNHEDIYFNSLQDSSFRKNILDKYGSGNDYSISEITMENRTFLQSLDDSKIIVLDGIKIAMYHGSPIDINDYVYPDSDFTKHQTLIDDDIALVLLGHTHHQFISCKGSTLIVNPGSVGQARDVRGLASYAVFDTLNKTVIPVRLSYKHDLIINKINKVEKLRAKALVSSISGVIQ